MNTNQDKETRRQADSEPQSGILRGELTKPAKHGFVLDLMDGERRVQVRVFEFENQQMPGLPAGTMCEMPVSIDEPHAITRLRQAMEFMREAAYGGMTNDEGRMTNEKGGRL